MAQRSTSSACLKAALMAGGNGADDPIFSDAFIETVKLPRASGVTSVSDS